jgi:hypothetical protein
MTPPRHRALVPLACSLLLGVAATAQQPTAAVPLGRPQPLQIANQKWQLAPAAPAIEQLEPTTGPTGGDTWVTILGAAFAPQATVRFGERAAGEVEWLAGDLLRARTPAGPPGSVDVTVENRPGYATTLTNGFSYHTPPPRMLAQQFDVLDMALNGGEGYKGYNNETATLAWGESYIMMAYDAMYGATGDPYYLKKLADHADGVLQQRDDVRGVSDYRGVSAACWRDLHYQDDNSPYCYVVHSGMIIYPMLQLVLRVDADPTLETVPTFDGGNLLEKANEYRARSMETVAAHDWQWHEGPFADEGYYLFPTDAPPGVPSGNLPSNQQNALARAMVALYQTTGDPLYADRVERMARLFLRATELNGNAYVWDYWNLLGDTGFDGPGEDISHAAINVDFAAVATAAGLYFDAADMAHFVATFTDNVAAGDGEVHDRVDGSGNSGSYEIQSGRWLGLSAWDRNREIYFTTQGVFEELFDWSSAGGGSGLLGVANLALWEGAMELRGVYTGHGSASDWAGSTGADLDGDGRDEFCAVRNFDGSLYAYNLRAEDGGVTSWGYNAGLGAQLPWAGLAGADLDDDGRDELIAPSNADGQIYFFSSPAAGQIEEAWHTSNWGSGSDWAGVGAGVFAADSPPWVVLARNFDGGIWAIDYDLAGGGSTRASNSGFGADADWADLAVGDFDGDGFGEIVIARNSDAHIFILDHVGSDLPVIAEISGFGPASDWAAVAAADLDGDGVDEILAVRNFDGHLYAWKLVDGQLQSVGHFKPFGTTNSWGTLAGGRFARGWNGELLAGQSNRTGNLHFYGME